MHELSVREFKKYCDRTKILCIIFDTDNQKWSKIEHNLRMKLVFDNVSINYNPNTICLSSSSSRIYLDRVKRIKQCEESLLGDVFDIVCSDKTYTLIVQYQIL